MGDKQVNGWLDRKGFLHPCKFLHHSKEAMRLMKKLQLKSTPEYLGWVKVHDAGVFFYEAWSYVGRQHVRPTQRQKSWLFSHGYDVSLACKE